MDAMRVVEVWSPTLGSLASGYLVTEDVVLTACHALAPAPGEPPHDAQVRPLGRERAEGWARAEAVWPPEGADSGVDAALLRVTDPAWIPPVSGSVPWGRITGDERRPCRAVGFAASERRGHVRDTKEINGHIERLTGLKSGLITVHVDRSATPNDRAGSDTGWAGASGAALFCEQWLVGVVTTDRSGTYPGDLLTAVPVTALCDEAGFVAALAETPRLHDLPRRPTPQSGGDVPWGFTNLPEPSSAVFVGRAAEWESLGETLHAVAGPGLTAIHGLGGVGKTSLALHYAHSHADDYRLVWWIEAHSAEAVTRGMAALSRHLPVRLAADATDEQAAASAMAWLQGNPGWLLVLDDAAAPDEVAPFTGPLRRSGLLLVTSRHATGWRGATEVRLSTLHEEQSIDLLTALTGLDAVEERGQAAELARELGGLPLALQQAGAFIAETQIDYPEYLRLLRSHPSEVYGAITPGLVTEHSVARTWRITLDRISQRSPLSVELLRILSWYAPTGIPRDLLDRLCDSDTEGHLPDPPQVQLARDLASGYDRREVPEGLSELLHADPWGERWPQVALHLADSPVELHRALSVLAAYSMIALGRQSIDVHRLVQAVTRIAEEGDPHRSPPQVADSRERATVLLKAALPINPSSNLEAWPRWRSLLPHVEALAAATPTEHDTETGVRVFEQTRGFLRTQGSLRRSLDYARRALAAAERIHGGDSLIAIHLREELAGCLGDVDGPAAAIALYEQVLEDRARVLGEPENVAELIEQRVGPWTGIGLEYLDNGEPDRAIPLLERSLAAWESWLDEISPPRSDLPPGAGSDPGQRLRGEADEPPMGFSDNEGLQGYSIESHVLHARRLLAAALQEAGQAQRSVAMLEQVAADTERLFGPDFRETQDALFSLGFGYLRTERPEEAIPCFARVAEVGARRMGPDHPDTLAALESLARAHREAGRHERAVELGEQVLAAFERAEGTSGHHSRRVRKELAAAYRDAGRHDQAVAHLRHLLQEESQGSGPAVVLQTACDLAQACTEAGRREEARSLLREHLAEAEARLGGDAEALLEPRYRLARLLAEDTEHGEAAGLYEQVVAAAERLGADDGPRLHGARLGLALSLGHLGDPARAIAFAKDNLALEERVFAPEDPRLRYTCDLLAALHVAVGDRDGALPYYRRALAHGERYGAGDNPDQLELRLRLARSLHSRGDPREAADVLHEVLGDADRSASADEHWLFPARRLQASAFLELGEPQRAAARLEECVEVVDRLLGDDPQAALVRVDLALAYLRLDRPVDALPLLEWAVPAVERHDGPQSMSFILVRQNLAMAKIGAGAPEQGLALLGRCVQDAERLLGAEHPATVQMRRVLAEERGEPSDDAPGSAETADTFLDEAAQRLAAAVELANAGELETAIAQYTGLAEDLERALGPEDPNVLVVLHYLGDALAESGEFARAVPLYARVLRQGADAPDEETGDTAAVRRKLAMALRELGEFAEAQAELRRALAEADTAGTDEELQLLLRNDLGISLLDTEEGEQAVAVFEELVVEAERILAADHPWIATFHANLADARGGPEQSPQE
jgi:tetratricopeptide (TPR) repeat protein